MKILEKKIGCFGWNVWLVLDIDGNYKIGLVNANNEFYCKYYENKNLEKTKIHWEMI